MRALRTITLLLILHFLPCHIMAKNEFLSSMPKKSEVISGFSISTLKSRMATAPLHHIEGIWQFTDNGATVAIERHRSADRTSHSSILHGYRIILITSPNRALRPGTVMGYIAPTAKSGQYTASIYSSVIGSTLILPNTYTRSLPPNQTIASTNVHLIHDSTSCSFK